MHAAHDQAKPENLRVLGPISQCRTCTSVRAPAGQIRHRMLFAKTRLYSARLYMPGRSSVETAGRSRDMSRPYVALKPLREWIEAALRARRSFECTRATQN